jgi:hypothetical protein
MKCLAEIEAFCAQNMSPFSHLTPASTQEEIKAIILSNGSFHRPMHSQFAQTAQIGNLNSKVATLNLIVDV